MQLFLSTKILLPFLFGTGSFPLILLFNNNSYTEGNTFVMLPNYNGQADMMLSLQIAPDYYPYQFKQQKLYDYLTNTASYITSNKETSAEKQTLAEELPKRIKALIGDIKKFGPSLWNQDLYDTGIVYRNDQFWSSMTTTYLFIEQFIADDYMQMFNGINILPAHKELMLTNYRVARDPYSIFNKKVFEFFKSKTESKAKAATAAKIKRSAPSAVQPVTDESNKFNEELYKYYETYSKTSPNSLYRFSKFIDFWNEHFEPDSSDKSKNTSQLSDFFTLAAEDEKIFYLNDDTIDKQLAEQYVKSVFSSEETTNLKNWYKKEQPTLDWTSNYLQTLNKKSTETKLTATNYHHPALEHQTVQGSAPLSEGSQKEVMVYLYQFAKTFQKISKSNDFEKNFINDKRKPFVKQSFDNAKLIATNYKERIKSIRDYFKKLNVIDSSFDPDAGNYTKTGSKVLTIVTHTPNGLGAGNSTIQSISKFPFIYRDIGFQQVVPNFFKKTDTQHTNTVHDHSHTHSHADASHTNKDITDDLEHTFAVDDNGWWWNIGNTNIDTNNLKHFTNTSDSVILLATPDDWNLLGGENNRTLSALSTVFKKSLNFKYEYQKINTSTYPLSYQKYNLWNEGLRSPIAINLLLDNLIEIIKLQYETKPNEYKDEYKKAQDWGDYWTTHFVKGTNVAESNQP